MPPCGEKNSLMTHRTQMPKEKKWGKSDTIIFILWDKNTPFAFINNEFLHFVRFSTNDPPPQKKWIHADSSDWLGNGFLPRQGKIIDRSPMRTINVRMENGNVIDLIFGSRRSVEDGLEVCVCFRETMAPKKWNSDLVVSFGVNTGVFRWLGGNTFCEYCTKCRMWYF